jgi:arylsulfatase A-like enzyme
VRFIELTCLPRPAELGQIGNPWDQHGGLKTGHAEMATQVDQQIAGLIHDLKRRGLFDETLVVWAGEFGRTVYGQGGLVEDYGRDHHGRCFSIWLAGGGVKPGLVYGRTDDFSYNIVENPVHVHDLNATLLHLLGVDHERLTYRFQGRDYRLTDVHGRVVKDLLA